MLNRASPLLVVIEVSPSEVPTKRVSGVTQIILRTHHAQSARQCAALCSNSTAQANVEPLEQAFLCVLLARSKMVRMRMCRAADKEVTLRSAVVQKASERRDLHVIAGNGAAHVQLKPSWLWNCLSLRNETRLNYTSPYYLWRGTEAWNLRYRLRCGNFPHLKGFKSFIASDLCHPNYATPVVHSKRLSGLPLQ